MKKIDGKNFKLKESHLSKSEAKFIAKDERKKGLKARVIKEKDLIFGKGYSYSIYIH